MLLNFNALSKGRYETTQQEFRKHTLLLSSMKKDLDAVFKRIRYIHMYKRTFVFVVQVQGLIFRDSKTDLRRYFP